MGAPIPKKRDPGIYVVEKTSTPIQNSRDMADVIRRMHEAFDPDLLIGNAERVAVEIVTEFVNSQASTAKDQTGSRASETSPALETLKIAPLAQLLEGLGKLPEDAPSHVSDAHALLFDIRHRLRPAIEAKNLDFAVACAYRVGRRAEQMGVRPFEEFVRTGRKATAQRAQAHMTAHGTPEDRQARYNGWQKQVDQLVLEKGLTYSSALAVLTKRGAGKRGTIRKHTTNPRPRRAKQKAKSAT